MEQVQITLEFAAYWILAPVGVALLAAIAYVLVLARRVWAIPTAATGRRREDPRTSDNEHRAEE